jgi:hypothetical protein
LECISNQENTTGITVEEMLVPKDKEPVVIQNCTINCLNMGIQVLGVDLNSLRPVPVRGLLIRDNKIHGAAIGISLKGAVNDVHVVANRITNCSAQDIRLADLYEGSGGILIANNSLKDLHHCLEIVEPRPGVRDVDIRNNLILAAQGPDIRFVGKDRQVLSDWRIEHNRRQAHAAAPSGPEEKEWVPATKDQVVDRIALLSEDASNPNFLRPDAKSDSAKQGTGQEDPSLPTYIGAVPPEGVPPWDWDRTWHMPRPAQLLTVSKDAKDGGKYRSINDALKDAKPWATIRVLDDRTYAERVVIDTPAKHDGLFLHSPMRAALAFSQDTAGPLVILGVAHVTISGLRLRPSTTGQLFPSALATGRCPGLVLEDLDIHLGDLMIGILLQDPRLAPEEAPVKVQRCRLRVEQQPARTDGIVVSCTVGGQHPLRNIVIRENRIEGTYRGILLQGAVRDCQVAGNLVRESKQAALQIEDLLPESDRILIVNNTVHAGMIGFRLWDSIPFKSYSRNQVIMCNNLFFGCGHADMQFVLDRKDGKESTPGDAQSLMKLWQIYHNGRFTGGSFRTYALPFGRGDRAVDQDSLSSIDPADPNFMRPVAGSPPAEEGAGVEDPSLPRYAGAVPPKGVEPWDWDRTWRARSTSSGLNKSVPGDKK